MKTLEDLYYGRIQPCDYAIRPGSRSEHLQGLVARHERTLEDTLSGAQREVFHKFWDAVAEMNEIAEREAFIKGFRLAANLLIEVTASAGEENEILMR